MLRNVLLVSTPLLGSAAFRQPSQPSSPSKLGQPSSPSKSWSSRLTRTSLPSAISASATSPRVQRYISSGRFIPVESTLLSPSKRPLAKSDSAPADLSASPLAESRDAKISSSDLPLPSSSLFVSVSGTTERTSLMRTGSRLIFPQEQFGGDQDWTRRRDTELRRAGAECARRLHVVDEKNRRAEQKLAEVFSKEQDLRMREERVLTQQVRLGVALKRSASAVPTTTETQSDDNRSVSLLKNAVQDYGQRLALWREREVERTRKVVKSDRASVERLGQLQERIAEERSTTSTSPTKGSNEGRTGKKVAFVKGERTRVPANSSVRKA